MTEHQVLPDYQTIATQLEAAKIRFDAAQVHGFFCGLICSNLADQEPGWKALILDGKKELESLDQLYETTQRLLQEFSFEFNLLLPSDDVEINKRTEALGLWCQGFLAGLEKNNIPLKNRQPGEVTDALNDIIEIAQVEFGEIPDTEEEETAFFELTEYVRLSALMMYQDLKADTREDSTEG